MSKRALYLVCIALGLLALAACRPAPTPVPATPTGLPTPEKGRVLMVIAPENFRDEEYARPREILESAGYAVVVASRSRETARGMLGMRVQPDLLLSEARAADYDAVVFVGGSGAQTYWDDPEAHRLAQEAADGGKVVAAICIAPVILARAGVLEGKQATVFDPPSLCAELTAHGATCTGASVQRDGRTVTASGPQAAEDFARSILAALEEP
jgi:protease I